MTGSRPAAGFDRRSPRPIDCRMKPSRERWERIERLVDAALDVPTAEREVWLRNACGDDETLCTEVLALIDAGERDDAFLAAPLADVAPALPSDTAQSVSAGVPFSIGPYRVLREIGRGGMGVVYLAERETHFAQRVALKLVRSGLPSDDHLLRRFVEERRILASLDHANIARLLDGGVTADGAHWFAMEYVEGEPIDQWCNARRLPVDARLELFSALCEAVEYAHERQVIHRDIKPSNILVRADGTLKLLDFGVAKLIADDTTATDGLTRTGTRLLTPEYASPEQIRGDPVAPASDVYSLGVVLYELLTGRRPYRVPGRSRVDIERAVLEQMPTRPSAAVARELGARLRGALDDIVLHALAKSPEQRYPSAKALADDIRHHPDGSVVAVRARRSRRRRTVVRRALVPVALVVTAIVGWKLVARPSRAVSPDATLPVTAIGLVADYRDPARTPIARSLADLLATNLARIPSLPVVSTARLYEVMAQLGAKGGGDDAGAYSVAARRAGATTLIDGGLYRLSNDSLRLELRRIDLATGNVVAVFTITGTDIFTLVDRGTARLATHLGSAAPPGSVADVTTRSEMASRFYEEGLRAYYYGDVAGSRRLLQAALAEDSTFAMAEYYLSYASAGLAKIRHLERALQLAERASDRERLIIRSMWMLFTADPASVATSETLIVRYPQELEGLRLSGKALTEAGDYRRAITRLREVIQRDSLALRGATAVCSACEAWYDLVGVYMSIDSLEVAEREARRAVQAKRVSALAWIRLADVLRARGDMPHAREAYGRATEIDQSLIGLPSYFAYYYLPGGDFETADRALREIAQSGSLDRRADANWFLAISLRNQGRFREALDVARIQRAQAVALGIPGGPPQLAQLAYLEAQVLFELGRYRDAATLFDSIAQAGPGFSPSHQARHRSWSLTHAASSLFAAGDTLQLRERIDTIRAVGSRSLLARDQRLHHYARGLLLVARRQDAQAVEEFRQASASPLLSFSRNHYELGRALLRLGRPAEAVDAVRPPVHGPLDGSNLYVTNTELRELLGRAFDLAGAPDSALVQYRQVLHAWQRADPALGARVDSIRARVAALAAGDSVARR